MNWYTTVSPNDGSKGEKITTVMSTSTTPPPCAEGGDPFEVLMGESVLCSGVSRRQQDKNHASLVTYGLRSCVSIAVWSPGRNVVALVHFTVDDVDHIQAAWQKLVQPVLARCGEHTTYVCVGHGYKVRSLHGIIRSNICMIVRTFSPFCTCLQGDHSTAACVAAMFEEQENTIRPYLRVVRSPSFMHLSYDDAPHRGSAKAFLTPDGTFVFVVRKKKKKGKRRRRRRRVELRFFFILRHHSQHTGRVAESGGRQHHVERDHAVSTRRCRSRSGVYMHVFLIAYGCARIQ